MMARVALVVDDSMLVRHAVSRLLEGHGFQVESAADGLEALEMVQHLHPSLIITDLEMPRMSGTELIAALKARPATADIPIIARTVQRGSAQRAEPAFPHMVYKDIDIVAELNRVLQSFAGTQAVAP